jgi:hypothetical protein
MLCCDLSPCRGHTALNAVGAVGHWLVQLAGEVRLPPPPYCYVLLHLACLKAEKIKCSYIQGLLILFGSVTLS